MLEGELGAKRGIDMVHRVVLALTCVASTAWMVSSVASAATHEINDGAKCTSMTAGSSSSRDDQAAIIGNSKTASGLPADAPAAADWSAQNHQPGEGPWAL